ncbi:MAG: hypothetical protein ABRQ38_01990 [Candidatus Eremiobacterota bacterium]
MNDEEREKKIMEYMARRREVFEELCKFILNLYRKEKPSDAELSILPEGTKIILDTHVSGLI